MTIIKIDPLVKYPHFSVMLSSNGGPILNAHCAFIIFGYAILFGIPSRLHMGCDTEPPTLH